MRIHCDLFKIVFIGVASRGQQFPVITWGAFNQFCIDANIFDKRGAKLATIDRIFITVDQGSKEVDMLVKGSFCRCEFFESLVRIAVSKYKDQGKCETVV